MNCAHQTSAATLATAPAQLALSRHAATAQTLVERLGATLDAWRHQWRSRQDLLALDERLLKDVGLTRSQVHTEASKPFWRG